MIEEAVLNAGCFNDVQRELLAITWQMIEAINTGDANTYARLCAEDLSCFEDVCPQRVDGLEFHLSLIRQSAQNPALLPVRFDIVTPRVQVYADTGIVTYIRLTTYDDGGRPHWTTGAETRVFCRLAGAWKMTHFHRSVSPHA